MGVEHCLTGTHAPPPPRALHTNTTGGRGALSHRHTHTTTTTTKSAPYKHHTDTHARRTHNVDTTPRVYMPTTREVHAASAACMSYARHTRTRHHAPEHAARVQVLACTDPWSPGSYPGVNRLQPGIPEGVGPCLPLASQLTQRTDAEGKRLKHVTSGERWESTTSPTGSRESPERGCCSH